MTERADQHESPQVVPLSKDEDLLYPRVNAQFGVCLFGPSLDSGNATLYTAHGQGIAATAVPRDPTWGGEFTGHLNKVTALAIAPVESASLLVSTSEDLSIRVWSLETRQALNSLYIHSAVPTTVAISPDETQVVSGGSDGEVVLMDVSSGLVLFRTNVGERICSVTFDIGGRTFQASTAGGGVFAWDRTNLTTAFEERHADASSYPCVLAAYPPPGTICSARKTARLTRISDKVLLQETNPNWGQTKIVHLSPGFKHIVCCYDSGSILWWPRNEAKQLARNYGEFTHLALSRSERFVAKTTMSSMAVYNYPT